MKIKNRITEFFDVVTFMIMMIGIVLVIRLFIFNPFSVIGQSMEPTIHEGDFILLDKFSIAKSSLPDFIKSGLGITADLGIKRGDIIVFAPPGKTVPYIKRIIGTPGETVVIADGNVSVCPNLSGTDCKVLDEPYLSSGAITQASCGKSQFPIYSGYFAMGDNRGHSTDSSCCFSFTCLQDSQYTVPVDHIIGKVRVRVFPDYTTY